MTARKQPPSSLCGEEGFIVECESQTRRVYLTLLSQASFDLGSYWKSDERVLVTDNFGNKRLQLGAFRYLASALGGDETFAQDILSMAYTSYAAYADVGRRRCVPLTNEDRSKLEAATNALLFKKERDISGEEDGTREELIDPIVAREESRPPLPRL